MSSFRSVVRIGAAALALAAAPIAFSSAARADACDRLWYERNSIYADAGYCFQTARARAVFGARCYSPYGRLSPGAQRQVNEIQAEEDGRGCPR